MRISDWSSDVCSSDLVDEHVLERRFELRNLRGRGFLQMRAENDLGAVGRVEVRHDLGIDHLVEAGFVRLILADVLGNVGLDRGGRAFARSEEHTSELQSLMRNSNAVFCLKKKTQKTPQKIGIANFQNKETHDNAI